jgi:excinuclease UvrABC nuclease subunit
MAKRKLNHIAELEGIGFEYLYLSARRYKDIPKASGVYCFVDWDIFTKESQILYVGKSLDLSIRLKPWHKVERAVRQMGYVWPNCFIYLCSNQDELEIELIRKYQPKFNVQHNPNIQRKIIYTNAQTLY